jgi:hypothetical protein
MESDLAADAAGEVGTAVGNGDYGGLHLSPWVSPVPGR